MKEIAAFLLLSVAGALAARADNFLFSFTGAGIQTSGTLTATFDSASNDYDITSITGEFNNAPITGLVATTATGSNSYFYPATTQFFFYDNLILNMPTPTLDDPGLLFTVSGLASPVNLFNRGTAGMPANAEGVFNFGTNSFVHTAGTLSLTNASIASPEPATWALLLGALAMLAGARRRRPLPLRV